MEMVAATAITSSLMVSSMVVVRSSYAAWQAHQGDVDRLVSADAVLRHVVRGIRQAAEVSAITDSTNTTGRLDLVNAAGGTDYWEHTGTGDGYVVYNAAGAILAEGINQLTFVGYEADGVTETTTPEDVQLIKCTVQVTLPRGAGQIRTVSCQGWLRSW